MIVEAIQRDDGRTVPDLPDGFQGQVRQRGDGRYDAAPAGEPESVSARLDALERRVTELEA